MRWHYHVSWPKLISRQRPSSVCSISNVNVPFMEHHVLHNIISNMKNLTLDFVKDLCSFVFFYFNILFLCLLNSFFPPQFYTYLSVLLPNLCLSSFDSWYLRYAIMCGVSLAFSFTYGSDQYWSFWQGLSSTSRTRLNIVHSLTVLIWYPVPYIHKSHFMIL